MSKQLESFDAAAIDFYGPLNSWYQELLAKEIREKSIRARQKSKCWSKHLKENLCRQRYLFGANFNKFKNCILRFFYRLYDSNTAWIVLRT